MSRRAPRSRNTLRIARLLTCFLAASALIVGTVAPATAATASVSTAGASVARASGPAATGIAKTTLAGFNAGNIISDAVFTNKNSMSEAQIQAFFNSKVSRCLGGTDSKGRPIVCLKDFTITTVTRPADAYCSGYTGAANESAARIIYRAAQACNINPQVLIVMLQKEQSLVTNNSPDPGRFNIALGQGCPDNAPCAPQYVGFFHQIYGAARQMQIYMEGKWFQWYAPGRTWNILYHPEPARGCGSSPVYIANKATSALYYYTPYQPNAAAMAAGYGEGDRCSSHGNRNFYNYFTDWFGSTQVPTSMVPTLSSIDMSSFVLGVDGAGDVWGYPYLNGAWGDRVKVGAGLTGVKKFFGIGDLDGDGHRDFVAIKTSGAAQLVKSNGTTTLGAPTALAGDWSGVVLATPAGDFNGDGIPDLFTTDAAGRLMLWPGNDRGGFAVPRVVGTGWSSMNLITGNGDFDGDGLPDLVSRDAAGRLYVYSGDGKGTWKGSKQIGNGWLAFTDIFNTGDFNGDGKSDLLTVNSAGTLRLYRGAGGGALGADIAIGMGWQSFNASASGAAVWAPRALPAGAGNLDGVYGRDLVAMTTTGEVRVYGTTGNGNWGGIMRPAGAWAATDRLIAMGDFNGDGFSDLGQVDAAGTFYLHPGVSGGGFGPRVVIGNGWGSFTRIVGGLDFDGDRVADVLAVDTRGDLFLYRANGVGGWAGGTGLTIGQGWAGFTDLFSAGDFDGDGAGDLMGRTSTGLLMLYSTTGTGSWGNARPIGQGWGGMATVFSMGDFNGDGLVDVLAVATNGDMYIYRGNGRGGWTADPTRINMGWQIMKQLI